jgi:hypothetical protein
VSRKRWCKIALADGSKQANRRRVLPVQRRDQALGEIGPAARGPLGEPVRHSQHGRPDDVWRRLGPLADAVALDQPAIELPDLPRLDLYALARGDTGREAVDDITTVECALDDCT